MLIPLILNLYRQELATANNINLKPVILFKAKKTIKESEQNKVDFHNLIDLMSPQMVDQIRNKAAVSIVQKAFNFFDSSLSYYLWKSADKLSLNINNCY